MGQDVGWRGRCVTKPRRAQGSSALAELAGANKTNVAIEVDVEPIDVHDPPLAIPAEIQHVTAACYGDARRCELEECGLSPEVRRG